MMVIKTVPGPLYLVFFPPAQESLCLPHEGERGYQPAKGSATCPGTLGPLGRCVVGSKQPGKGSKRSEPLQQLSEKGQAQGARQALPVPPCQR
eukprot:5808688-Amphidinium_carterae.1